MMRTTFLPVLASFVLFACGGSVEKVPDPNGSTSPSTPAGGGSTATGGSKSGATSGSGGVGAAGGEESQCDGRPECGDGWTQVTGCVPDSECAQLTTCGETIICQKIDPTCEGPRPLCDAGDEEIEGKNACPQDAKCYSRSNNCNFTVWCASK